MRAFWPFWSILVAGFAALAFDVQDNLPLEAFWIGAVLTLAALVWALVRGIRSFHRPKRDEALARIDARLPGQPIAALMDRPALGATDPTGQALWEAHQRRMAERADRAEAVAPDLNLARRDPFALRYVAFLALVMAALFGSFWQAASVTGLMPGGVQQAAAAGPAWEGWAEPPAYTGKPTLYLADQSDDALSLPVGTHIRLRLYGQPGKLILAQTVSDSTDQPPASAQQQDFTIRQSGRLAIEGPGGRSWQVDAVPDAPPTIAATGPVTRQPGGKFALPFKAADDYGVVKGQVSVALDLSKVDRRYGLTVKPEADVLKPVILDLPLPMTRDRTKLAARLTDDLSQSVLSNMPVTLTLSVTDAAGQTGTAPPIEATLPGLRFFDPLAKALIEMRRDLMWNRANGPWVTEILKALTWKPQGFIKNDSAYLRLRAVIRNLDTAGAKLTADERDSAVTELWKIALLVENGDLNSALERLHRAEDRLSEAIRNGASQDEINKLMQEMRQAMNQYLQQQAQQNGQGQQMSQNGGPTMQMTQGQLQGMLDKLQQLMKEGRMAEAQQLMDQLRQFMDNMRVTQGGPGGQGQTSPNQQAMKDLGQALKDQQGLADRSFRDLQQQNQGGSGESGSALADRQQALKDRLGQIQDQGGLPGGGTPQGQEGQKQLDRAGRAMSDAEKALRQGNLSGALDSQAQALDAMRQGMKAFGEALAANNRPGGQNGQGSTAQAQTGPTLDPLGRQLGAGGSTGTAANMLQGPDVYRRAQQILDEIRKRAGQQNRPTDERNYLKRLLELF